MSKSLDLPQSASPHARDAAAMACIARGDHDAFAAMYEEHRARMFRLAYAVVLDVDDATEAVQEAFLRLHANAPRWQANAAVSTWLHRVVLNYCLSLRRRLARVWRASLAATPQLSAELAVSAVETTRAVERCLAMLSARHRAVLTLHLDAELRPAEIAPIVGLTPNATRVALHRALDRLRASLREAGIEATPMPDASLSLAEEEP